MRHVDITIGDATHKVAITWELAERIAHDYADPLDISQDVLAAAADGDHAPAYPFNLRNSVKLCALATGLPESEVGQAALDHGAGGLVEAAVAIIVAIVSADAEVGAAPGKKAPRTGRK